MKTTIRSARVLTGLAALALAAAVPAALSGCDEQKAGTTTKTTTKTETPTGTTTTTEKHETTTTTAPKH
jgi:hypothetical protein